MPAGKRTVPPPAAAAAAIALSIAAVSRVLPSPLAPNIRTSSISPAADGISVVARVARPPQPRTLSARRPIASGGLIEMTASPPPQSSLPASSLSLPSGHVDSRSLVSNAGAAALK